MTDDELRQFAWDFRVGMIGDTASSEGCCFMISAPLAGLLRSCGVACELVGCDFPEAAETEAANHFWIALPDGRVLDPTFDQFCSEEPVAIYLGAPTEFHPDNEATHA